MTPLRTAQAISALVPASIGNGQTWQNVKASRAINTSYQNTTGQPIMVLISMSSGSAQPNFQVSANGSTWITLYDREGLLSFIVPDTHYYKVINNSTINFWSELR